MIFLIIGKRVGKGRYRKLSKGSFPERCKEDKDQTKERWRHDPLIMSQNLDVLWRMVEDLIISEERRSQE